MDKEQRASESLLLTSEPVAPETLRGDSDLLAIHGLDRIASVIMAGNMKVDDYLHGIKHFTPMRR